LIPATEWDRCAPWISAALNHGDAALTHGISDVRLLCVAGQARFFPGRNCAGVFEIYTFPRLKRLHLWLVGGDMDELLNEILPLAIQWGIEEGCSQVTTAGRKGWTRVMAAHGFEPVAHICMRDLTP
jgi:hypothetical protein